MVSSILYIDFLNSLACFISSSLGEMCWYIAFVCVESWIILFFISITPSSNAISTVYANAEVLNKKLSASVIANVLPNGKKQCA